MTTASHGACQSATSMGSAASVTRWPGPISTETPSQARRLFGDDPANYRFRCVSCGRTYSVADWQQAECSGRRAPHECIGRACSDTEMRARANRGECVWTAGGLIVLASTVGVRFPDGTVALTMPFDEASQ